MYDVSVLIPSIRIDAWNMVYQGLVQSSQLLKWEIVFVGPKPGPQYILDKPNVKYIIDWGNPNRGTQIALLHAEGKYVLPGTDDGYFLPGSFDHMFDIMDSMGKRSPLNLVMGKFIEGVGIMMDEDRYYRCGTHKGGAAEYCPPKYYTSGYYLWDREFLLNNYGGFNMCFECGATPNSELSFRIQKFSKTTIKLTDKPIAKLRHTPGTSGDHAPMHHAQIDCDEPLYTKMLQSNTIKQKVCVNDWVNIPAIWTRRFPNIHLKYKYIKTHKYGRDVVECIYG